MNYPGELPNAVSAWLTENAAGSLRGGAARLSEDYKTGAASAAAHLTAYLAARLPATFAANQRVLAMVAEQLPHFAPESLWDVGAGPGTASWAALAQWPSIGAITQLEALPAFRAVEARLNAESGIAALERAEIAPADIRALPAGGADLVMASYVLAERPAHEAAALALALWEKSHDALVLIEPGTPEGFARIHAAREALRGAGGIAAPCTHMNECPMAHGNWCHFKVRLQRGRAHMHAKSAVVPFEDEAFSYVAFTRHEVLPRGGRIVSPVDVSKVEARLQVCDAGGLTRVSVASRSRAAYKRAKKARWGDLWSDDP